MDNYGQNNKGQLWVQKVTVLPSWTSVDIGRILLLTTTGDLYYSNNTGWSMIGGAGFGSGVKMYFYMNSAPAGWVIDTTVSDALIGVKGGVSHYNIAGGNLAGTWSQPTHTHTFSSIAHTHDVTIPISGYGGTSGGGWDGRLQPNNGGNSAYATTAPVATTTSVSAASGTTASGSPSDVWRPYTAVGIIATKL